MIVGPRWKEYLGPIEQRIERAWRHHGLVTKGFVTMEHQGDCPDHRQFLKKLLLSNRYPLYWMPSLWLSLWDGAGSHPAQVVESVIAHDMSSRSVAGPHEPRRQNRR